VLLATCCGEQKPRKPEADASSITEGCPGRLKYEAPQPLELYSIVTFLAQPDVLNCNPLAEFGIRSFPRKQSNSQSVNNPHFFNL
jgi:hypothetical protein